MKRGSKKTDKDETGSKKAAGDDSGSFRVTSDMIGGNPDGIDAIRVLQLIAGGIAALVLIWFILQNMLHVI